MAALPQRDIGQLAAIPVPPAPPFNCPSIPAPPPATNVTQLRPGNIKAVAVLGDSISAGFAMKGVPVGRSIFVFIYPFSEYRGLTFAAGGDEYVSDFGWEKAITIPNFLLHYSPGLEGQSFGETRPLARGMNLNGAVSGARVEDVPGQVNFKV